MPLNEGIPADFHTEFAAWMRIEPRARSNDIAGGIAARTADPLWMLTRQWQTGELDAEDAGSPIDSTLVHSVQILDRMRFADGTEVKPLPDMPLEALVECERMPMDWCLRVQIGQQFERYARSELAASIAASNALINGFRTKYPLAVPEDHAWTQTDRATRRFLSFMAGRVIDGGPLMADARLNTLLPPAGVTPEQLSKVTARLMDWFDLLVVQPPGDGARAWRDQQLDYRFEVNHPANVSQPPSASDPVHLIAPNYRNGALDWHTFSAASELPGIWSTPQTDTVTPTRVSIGGTSPRWWAFEDSATDFGAIEAAAPDLARLLLMEFVLIYGDDWFSVPLTVGVSRLARIDKLVVRNVFGEETPPIPPVGEVVQKAAMDANADLKDPMLRWELFTLALHAESDRSPFGSRSILLVPPIAGFRAESEALEDVHFLRDEGANLVWGVEHLVTNGLGRPVHGFDAQRERSARIRESELADLGNRLVELKRQLSAAADWDRAALEAQIQSIEAKISALRAAPVRATQGEIPAYRLATSVPENWIPFTPANAAGFFGLANPSIRLQRAQMLRNAQNQAPSPILAMTSLLSLAAPNPPMWLEESAVLRSGVRVQLTAQRMRWTDGKTYVWLGRKVLTGGGEGASGLRFDVLRSGR